jgi:rhodanese-related sulfurtransferase
MESLSAIGVMLAGAHAELDRVRPPDLAGEVAAGAVVVDVRSVEQRQRDGVVPGALVIDRNVLEWRLDPSSPYRVAEMTSRDLRVIIVCSEGYSSSLAAVTLRRLGLHRATDAVGGFQALLAHGWGTALGVGVTGGAAPPR